MSDDADLLIVGAGPCGLAAAISAQKAGLKPLVIESQVAVSSIAAYPAYVRFFSTAEKLAIGELPFVVATEKPSRRDALAYYRAVVLHFGVPLRQRERVTAIERQSAGDSFVVRSRTQAGEERRTRARAV
ncbi:MAG TPA: NAD(P)-binding domain-containing protein, partial [Gemmatimonadaceae bacterium]|nr:NAD(P)-binding domain-containing protein [Gemmatimonadaceae bacterium]